MYRKLLFTRPASVQEKKGSCMVLEQKSCRIRMGRSLNPNPFLQDLITPGVGPELAYLSESGRVTARYATDNEALESFS